MKNHYQCATHLTITYDFSMGNTLIAVLQPEFERGRVPAKDRAFF
jgi:hypothetical protein